MAQQNLRVVLGELEAASLQPHSEISSVIYAPSLQPELMVCLIPYPTMTYSTLHCPWSGLKSTYMTYTALQYT